VADEGSSTVQLPWYPIAYPDALGPILVLGLQNDGRGRGR
jgi:hypothetical protein